MRGFFLTEVWLIHLYFVFYRLLKGSLLLELCLIINIGRYTGAADYMKIFLKPVSIPIWIKSDSPGMGCPRSTDKADACMLQHPTSALDTTMPLTKHSLRHLLCSNPKVSYCLNPCWPSVYIARKSTFYSEPSHMCQPCKWLLHNGWANIAVTSSLEICSSRH